MTMQPDGSSVLTFLKRTPTTIRHLLLGALINQLGYLVQAYLIVFMIAQGFTVIEAGWGMAILGGSSIAGTLAGASLGSRIGNRNAIILSTAAMAASVALIPVLVDTAMPMAVWGASIFTCGLFAQMYRPAVATILSNHLSETQHVMGFAMYRIAINVGAAIGPVVATVLAQVDWSLVFWLNSACSLIYMGIAYVKLPNEKRVDAEKKPTTSPSSSGTWGEVIVDIKFWAFLWAMFLSSIVYAQIYSTVPAAIEAEGLALSTYSTLLTISAVILITCELKISSITSRFPNWIPATVGTTVLCLGIASFGLTLGSALGQILSMVVMVLGLMTSGPVMFAYPAKFPLAVRSRYIGATQAAFSSGNALGPVIGIYMFTHFGSLVWVFCTVLAIVSGVLTLLGMRQKTAALIREERDVEAAV